MSAHPLQTSSYTVREFGEADKQRWDEYLLGAPGGGHVLQSHQWGEFKRYQGWSPLRLVLERDGEVAGAGQFLLRSTLPAVPGKLMYASKGPWLDWSDEEAVRSFFQGAADIARREGVHTLKIEPEVHSDRTEVREMLGRMGFGKARYDLNFADTIIMDISPSEEELMKGMTGKNTRYNVRLAGRKGVEVSEPDSFDWAFDTFWRWMEDLSDQKEGYHLWRPREYYRRMMEAMSETGQGKFFFAYHEGKPLTMVYNFAFGDKMWFMLGASDRGNRKLKPTYLLQWEVIRWARERGIAHYDMVGIPKPEDRHEEDPYYGVYRFKKGFGGEVVEFMGCMDLPVRPRLAAAWYRLEPLYYRGYYRLKGNIFY